MTTDQNSTDGQPLGGLESAQDAMPAFLRNLPKSVADRLAARGVTADSDGDLETDTSITVTRSPEDHAEYMSRRRDALDAALPPLRKAAGCMNGLSVLDDDQHPIRLQTFLDDPDARVMLLVGKTGSGKTHAGYATTAQAARYGVMMRRVDGGTERRYPFVRAVTANDYVRAVQPDGSPLKKWEVRKQHVEAEWLFLSDLGADLDSAGTEFMRRELADLLDARHERMLKTLLDTNLGARALRERLGDRLWSRLHEHAFVQKFEGADRRRPRGDMQW